MIRPSATGVTAATAATPATHAGSAPGALTPEPIASDANALLVLLRRLARDGGHYRRAGFTWLEGEHLLSAARARGARVERIVISQSCARSDRWRDWVPAARLRPALVTDAAWASFGTLPASSAAGALLAIAPGGEAALARLRPDVPTVILDRLQDAGNVGSILRSAAALGVQQVVARSGTAGLWTPKVLRAAQGAHFALCLAEGVEDLQALAGTLSMPWVGTRLHDAIPLPQAALPRPCAWVFGNEGQGVDAAMISRCELAVSIPQPGGEESLNVAAAAAICLYEAARQMG